MIVTCADCITQRRKPSPLYQSGIGGELSSGHAAGVESVSIVGIGAEALVLKFLRTLNECLDPLLRLRVSRAMSLAHKTVVGILTGIHRPHAVELAHQHSGGYMVHHEGIVRMLLESALKILDGLVVFKIVEVLKATIDERIVGARFGCRLVRCSGLSR